MAINRFRYGENDISKMVADALERARTMPSYGGDFREPVVEVLSVCAKHDEPFLLGYKKTKSDKFSLSYVRKVEPGGSGPVAMTMQSRIEVITNDKLEYSDVKDVCPYCNCDGIRDPVDGQKSSAVKCGRCSCLVCMGRSETVDGRILFKCRPSCGSESFLSGERCNLTGTITEQIAVSSIVSTRREWKQRETPRLAAAPNRLLLGSGKKLLE